MSITLSALQQQRRDTAANWTSANPTLLAGEIGVETDTGLLKIGDGSTAWTSLDYLPLSFEGYAANGIYNPAANQVALATNGTGRLFIDSSGNIGVGTASPNNQLHLVGSSASNYLRIDGSTGNRAFLGVESGAAVIYAQDNSGGNAPITFNTGSSERMQIDSSGRLLVGTSSSNSSFNSGCQIAGTGLGGTQLINRFDASVGGPILYFAKSRNATVGSNTIVQSGDILGSLEFYGANGTGYNAGAQIRAFVDGAPGAINDMPGRLVFSTSADNSSSPTERMRIDSSGKIRTPAGSSTRIGVDDRTSAGNGGNLIISAGSGSGSGNTAGNLILATSRGLSAAPTGVIKFGYNDGLNGLDLDGSGEQMRIDSSGRLLLGTSTEGNGDADDITVATSGNTGITVRSGTANTGNLYFSDATSGTAEFAGAVTYSHSSNELRFRTNTTENVVIDSSGRVGIGTPSPARQLTLYNSSTPIIQLVNSTTGQTANDGVMLYESGSNFVIENQEPGEIQIYNNGSQRAVIDSSGRLLVGTSSAPTGSTSQYAYLTVRGNTSGSAGGGLINLSRGVPASSLTSGANIGTISFTDSTTGEYAAIKADTDGTSGASDYPGRLEFYTTADSASSPTERMRIGSNGKVSIGRGITNLASFTTAAYLKLSTGADTTTGDFSCESYAANAGTRYHFGFSNTNGLVGSITTNSSATAFNTSSDYRLKENVVDLDGAITRVKQLAPKRFNFIADSNKTVDGFLAHEAQTVVPEAVTGAHNEVDDDGNPVYQGIDQSKLVPLLTAALQEAIAKIETLEQRLTDAGL